MNNRLWAGVAKGNPTDLKQSIVTIFAAADAMWFLPSALNVKVLKFKQARVNGGSNCLISSAHEWINEIPSVSAY